MELLAASPPPPQASSEIQPIDPSAKQAHGLFDALNIPETLKHMEFVASQDVDPNLAALRRKFIYQVTDLFGLMLLATLG
jgi:hypothetical protein